MKKRLISEIKKERCNAAAFGAFNNAINSGIKAQQSNNLAKGVTEKTVLSIYKNSIEKAKEITNIIKEGKSTEKSWTNKDTKDYDKIRKNYLKQAGMALGALKRINK